MFVTQKNQRRLWPALLLIALSFTVVGNVSAAPFPEVIPLPNGFQPEGIASGDGTTFYVGSIPTGAIYQGDLATGDGTVLIPPQAGRNAIGLKYDPRSGYLFVAGGMTGDAYVYDTLTGATVAAIHLTDLESFINDVVITQNAAYYTNSFQPILYRVAIGDDGEVAPEPEVTEIFLGGDYVFSPGAFNANGIAATPNGETLIIVNSVDGVLYTVDPISGVAMSINLGGRNVQFGDGILLHGKTLYVVQNRLNQVAVIQLNPDFSAGIIERTITSNLFRVPTTIARFGNSLYVVNARFGTPPTPETDYDVVRVPDE